MEPHELYATMGELEDVLSAEGVRGVLRFLNARAPHRFTGIYRLDPPMLRNVLLYDRQNPMLQAGADAPLRETYCSISGGQAVPFSTADAGQDARLEQHPARESTLSYCGVPLLDHSGQAVGTLCHFDLVPQPVPEAEIRVLEAAAPRVLAALRSTNALPA